MQDEAWKDALQRHLKVLQSHNAFSIWDDRQIEVGANWLPAIETAIEQAKVALLLVSSDFLTSEFVKRQEIPRFLQRREAEGLQIVPIIIKPCAWQAVSWLAALQGGTKDNRPLAQFALGSFESEQAFSEITLKVYNLLQAAQQAEEAKRLAELSRLAEQERLEQERLQREAEARRLAQEQAEREATERARQAELQWQHDLAEQAKREQLERERLAAAERAKVEQLEQEQAAAKKAEQERLNREQAELNRLGRERQEAEKGASGSGKKSTWLWGGIGASVLLGVVIGIIQSKAPETPPVPPNTTASSPHAIQTKPTPEKVAEPDKPAIPLPDMITIQGGSFEMGCSNGKDCYDNEKPVRTVPSSCV
nr:TIR domain-containing protein [uncultured Thiothrix sp.]